MPRYHIDDSGELVTGYFYRVYSLSYNMTCEDLPVGSIYRPVATCGDLCWVVNASITYRTDRYCTRNPKHLRRSSPLASAELHLEGLAGKTAGPIVPYDEAVFVNDDTNRQLMESELVGTDSVRCRIASWNDEPQRPPVTEPAIYALSFPGPDLVRKWQLEPADWPNLCPYCGHGPIICPVCGYPAGENCEKCGGLVSLNPDLEPEESKDPNSKILWVSTVPDEDEVLDASKWDGSDFCSGIACNIVTRRVVDFLVCIGAAPFLATPLRTYLGSCTPEQRERLVEAKRPVR